MKNNPPNDKPLFRVSFARTVIEDGKETVLRPKEIGAIWPRRNGKKGGILVFDHMPLELTRHQGVVFILPVEAGEEGGSR